jgi:hypothetical protein
MRLEVREMADCDSHGGYLLEMKMSVFSAGSRSSEHSFGFLTMKIKGDLVVLELLDFSTGRLDAGVECLLESIVDEYRL